MEYQNDWKRPKDINDSEMVADYYSKYEVFDGEFKADWHDVKVIYAYTTTKTFNDKNQQGLQIQSEVLNLILLLDNSDKYVTVTIWGARRHRKGEGINGEWSDWGANSVALQDCLYLIGQQKGMENINDHYDFSSPYEEREVYPHLCGAKLKMCAVHYADYLSPKGKIYPNNKYALFAPDGRSALEIQMNEDSKFDAKEVQKKYKELYAKYKADDDDETPSPAPKPDVVHEVPAPKAEPKADTDDDDLPF